MINQGNIRAEHALSLDVGGDLIQQSTTQTSHVNAGHYRQSDTHLDRKALLHVTGRGNLTGKCKKYSTHWRRHS